MNLKPAYNPYLELAAHIMFRSVPSVSSIFIYSTCKYCANFFQSWHNKQMSITLKTPASQINCCWFDHHYSCIEWCCQRGRADRRRECPWSTSTQGTHLQCCALSAGTCTSMNPSSQRTSSKPSSRNTTRPYHACSWTVPFCWRHLAIFTLKLSSNYPMTYSFRLFTHNNPSIPGLLGLCLHGFSTFQMKLKAPFS